MDDLPAAIISRDADPAVALEVDHMILDYLAYKSSHELLDSYHVDISEYELGVVCENLTAFQDFLRLFKIRHPTYQFDAGLQLRLKLLKLITLMSRRHFRTPLTPSPESLDRLRADNRAKAIERSQSIDVRPSLHTNAKLYENETPFPEDLLVAHRTRYLEVLQVADKDDAFDNNHDDKVAFVTLLDLLPLCMQVSASCRAMFDVDTSEQWMLLATEWMIQAVLEQYLVCGATGLAALDEAFAWSTNPALRESEDPIIQLIDIMLADDAETWEKLRTAAIIEMFPDMQDLDSQVELLDHLMDVSRQHPLSGAEEKFLDFISSIVKGIELPLLAQLERGHLDGMSQRETSELLLEWGVVTSPTQMNLPSDAQSDAIARILYVREKTSRVAQASAG